MSSFLFSSRRPNIICFRRPRIFVTPHAQQCIAEFSFQLFVRLVLPKCTAPLMPSIFKLACPFQALSSHLSLPSIFASEDVLAREKERARDERARESERARARELESVFSRSCRWDFFPRTRKLCECSFISFHAIFLSFSSLFITGQTKLQPFSNDAIFGFASSVLACYSTDHIWLPPLRYAVKSFLYGISSFQCCWSLFF